MSLNDVPKSGQTLGGTQPLIQANFADIETDFKVNHENFNDTDAGKHKFLQMPEQGSAPATAAGEGGLYTKDANSEPCLFYRRETNGDEVQLTTSATPTLAEDGYTFLPGGLLLQWGLETIPDFTTTTVTFPTAFSAAPYNIVASAKASTASEKSYGQVVNTPIAASFEWRNSTGTAAEVYWQAIGPA